MAAEYSVLINESSTPMKQFLVLILAVLGLLAIGQNDSKAQGFSITFGGGPGYYGSYYGGYYYPEYYYYPRRYYYRPYYYRPYYYNNHFRRDHRWHHWRDRD
jgi:hypothetical protein